MSPEGFSPEPQTPPTGSEAQDGLIEVPAEMLPTPAEVPQPTTELIDSVPGVERSEDEASTEPQPVAGERTVVARPGDANYDFLMARHLDRQSRIGGAAAAAGVAPVEQGPEQ